MKVFHILTFTWAMLTATSGTYWPCATNDDCTAKNSSCLSLSAQCSCTDFDTVFSSDFSTCLKTSLIGDQCEDSVQCNLMPTGAKCKAGVCDCADGETYVRGHCRTLNGLAQHCDTDLDCYFGYDRNSIQCKENLCTCANGYYKRHGNICRRKSMEVGDACVVHTDCRELGVNVKCKNLKCEITNEKNNNNYTNINNNKIIIDESENGENNIQYTIRKGPTSTTPTETNSNLTKSTVSESDLNVVSKLVNGQSTTSSNNNYNILSETDAEDDDLNTESKNEFTATALAIESREVAVQTSIDSVELRQTKFKRKVKNITPTASNSSNKRRLSKQQHRHRSAAFRLDDDDKTVSTLSKTDDDLENQEYGFPCTHNGLRCIGLPHSICSNNVCLCRQGYYNKGRKCFAELGEIAESSDECEHHFEAETKKCICQRNFFYDNNLRKCRKPIQYHLSCAADNQCSPFGDAYCLSEAPRRCSCKQYAEYDDILQLCVYKSGLGSQCQTAAECPIDHSTCANHTCSCKPFYLNKDNECLPGIGADCLDSDDCSVENSLCATSSASNVIQDHLKTCQCRKGFVHFKDECLKEAENIDDECADSTQCKPLLGSCVNEKCSCGDKQHFENGRCVTKKALNEACSTASECDVEKRAECRNSVCQCKFGYKTDSEHRTCVATNKINSSGRPSALKIITFILIGSAFLITSAALKQAYY